MERRELWVPIPGFPEHEASSEGRIKRVVPSRRGGSPAGRIITGFLRDDGYVGLSHRHFPGFGMAHQLIAFAFLGPCPAEHEVNHRDRVRSNNRIRNLEYLTSSQNKQHTMALDPSRREVLISQLQGWWIKQGYDSQGDAMRARFKDSPFSMEHRNKLSQIAQKRQAWWKKKGFNSWNEAVGGKACPPSSL